LNFFKAQLRASSSFASASGVIEPADAAAASASIAASAAASGKNNFKFNFLSLGWVRPFLVF
jgi:hypothetical protein